MSETQGSEDIKLDKWDEAKDGPITTQNVRRKLQSQGYRTIQYKFHPGRQFHDHSHLITKKDAIATGRFRFSMYGKEVILEPGDMVEVPKGTVHNAAVVGNEDVVFFDAFKCHIL